MRPGFCEGCHGCVEPCGRANVRTLFCTTCWLVGENIPAEVRTEHSGALCSKCYVDQEIEAKKDRDPPQEEPRREE